MELIGTDTYFLEIKTEKIKTLLCCAILEEKGRRSKDEV